MVSSCTMASISPRTRETACDPALPLGVARGPCSALSRAWPDLEPVRGPSVAAPPRLGLRLDVWRTRDQVGCIGECHDSTDRRVG